MKSMTGFSTAEITTTLGHLRVEMRSVNQKGLDLHWRLPRSVLHLEGDLGRCIRQKLKRGRISIGLQLELAEAQQKQIVLDVTQCQNILEQLDQFASKTPVLQKEIRSGDLLRFEGIWHNQNQELDEVALKQMALEGIEKAIKGLNEQRQIEGNALQIVLEKHLMHIEDMVNAVEVKQNAVPQEQFQICRERLVQLLKDSTLSEDRLLQEAAHMADRLDVSEEVNRLRIHIDHVKTLMQEEPVGRKLDFMCQEFIREANTVGSKCHDASVAHIVVELKAEVEKMREQVQNIE